MLALKAAYLHSQYPEWKIAVTFYTRSLAQQYEELIRQFMFEFSGEEPNWNNLYIVHARGTNTLSMDEGVIDNELYERLVRKLMLAVAKLKLAIKIIICQKATQGGHSDSDMVS